MMNRRLFLGVPGLGVLGALFASRAPAQVSGEGVAPKPSRKALVKHSGRKAAYKIPKSRTKQAKYLASVTALVALTTSQQQQAQAIFANAMSTRKTGHKNLKAARTALSEAVKANDTAAISQAAATISTLTAQRIANGALANAAFRQLLTPDQQAMLAQFEN